MKRVSATLLFGVLFAAGGSASAQDFSARWLKQLSAPTSTTARVQAVLCVNGAPTMATTVGAGLYYNRVPSTTCADSANGLVDEGPITFPPSSGIRCKAVDLNFGVLPAGRYPLAVQADNRCLARERNETDNIARTTLVVGAGKADLSARLGVLKLSDHRTVYTLTYCRSGVATLPVKARLFKTIKRDGDPAVCAASSSSDLASDVVDVGAGCTTAVIRTYRPRLTTERVCFAIDTGCDVPESSETNNIACVLYRTP